MCLTSFQVATADVSKDRLTPYFLTSHLGTHALITLRVFVWLKFVNIFTLG